LGPPVIELQPVRPTPVAAVLPRLRSFVSPLTGVVTRTAETLAAPDEHRLISIGCQLAETSSTIGSPLESYTGSEHWLREAAEAAAIGEALERYAGSYVPDERLVVASADELGPRAVEPERFALFSDFQHATPGFPFHPFRADTVVSWVDGFTIPGGEPAYLPAQLVYMPWRRQSLGETRIGHATSSGLACAPTLEEAVLTGLLELVERDAFMLTWHNRLSLPLLEWSDDAELERLDRRYFATTGLRYAAVDLSVFLRVPTVLGVVHGARGSLGALGVGAASAPTVATAWRKALAEAFSVQRWVRDQAFEQPERLGGSVAEIGSFDEHTLFYADEERAERAAFLDASRERRATAEIAPLEGDDVLELIEAVARRLAARGMVGYAVDVTSPDVRRGGLHVVRVVVPELCPLDVVEGARFLGGRRMYEAAFEAGLVPRPLEPADLNPDPHPFP
jgi:ribosomal protein S12 methylthiotransferase accessory factor